MDATQLVEGYRSVLRQIYSSAAYYERVKLYLSRTQPQRGERRSKQRWLTRGNARAFVTSIVRQGIFGPQRWSYWKFLLAVATRYRRCFGAAMTLAVMGYHFQVMTRKLTEAVDAAVMPVRLQEEMHESAGGK